MISSAAIDLTIISRKRANDNIYRLKFAFNIVVVYKFFKYSLQNGFHI